MLNKIKDFFNKGNSRSIQAKKNIIGSLLLKVISILISILMVPLTLHYVSPAKYGIWLTLSSIVAWMSFFDIGFTHGLRNRFAEAKAKNDTSLARTYVSTSYFYICSIFLGLWITLMFVNQFINWAEALNIDSKSAKEVSILAYIIFSYFCLQFIFKIVSTVASADQKPALASSIDLSCQLVSIISIYILTKLTTGSLINLGLALGIAPTIVMIIANIYLFKTKYRKYAPSYKFVKKEYAKDIMSLGIKFFVVQIAAIIQYQTVLFLIAHYFSTQQVTSYNIAYRYFGILQMGFAILVTPLWSGSTDAFQKNDFEWIKNAVKKYLLAAISLFVIGIGMLYSSQTIYNLWLGKGIINISFIVSSLCFLFIITSIYGNIFVFVINGIGAIQIQFYSSLITPIIFISLALFCIKQLNLGVESILISSIISNLFGIIIAPIQYYLIIYKNKKNGIWVK